MGKQGSYPHLLLMPAADKQTSHKESVQNQAKFFVSSNEFKKKSPKKNPLSKLPLSLQVGGNQSLDVLAGGMEIYYICHVL